MKTSLCNENCHNVGPPQVMLNITFHYGRVITMARSAEVVTIASLNSLLDSAKGDFAKSVQAKHVAEQVKNIPDAHTMLMESVTLHEQEAFKAMRKIVVKVINAIDERSVTIEECRLLIDMAKTWGLVAEKAAE